MNSAHPTSTPTVLPKLSFFSHDTKTRSTASASPPCCCYGRRIKHNNKHGIKNLHNFNSSSRGTFSSVNCSLNPGASSQKTNDQVIQRENERMGKGFWSEWKDYSAEMSSKLAELGLASVLAYGLFDGITYTAFSVLAFLGYEKSTGKNPAANPQALLG